MRVLIALSTQWRRRPDGRACGIDYTVLPIVEDRLGIKRRHRRELFAGLQLAESELLKLMRDGR